MCRSGGKQLERSLLACSPPHWLFPSRPMYFEGPSLSHPDPLLPCATTWGRKGGIFQGSEQLAPLKDISRSPRPSVAKGCPCRHDSNMHRGKTFSDGTNWSSRHGGGLATILVQRELLRAGAYWWVIWHWFSSISFFYCSPYRGYLCSIPLMRMRMINTQEQSSRIQTQLQRTAIGHKARPPAKRAPNSLGVRGQEPHKT